jgi:hypothetical protein
VNARSILINHTPARLHIADDRRRLLHAQPALDGRSRASRNEPATSRSGRGHADQGASAWLLSTSFHSTLLLPISPPQQRSSCQRAGFLPRDPRDACVRKASGPLPGGLRQSLLLRVGSATDLYIDVPPVRATGCCIVLLRPRKGTREGAGQGRPAAAEDGGGGQPAGSRAPWRASPATWIWLELEHLSNK